MKRTWEWGDRRERSVGWGRMGRGKKRRGEMSEDR